MRLSGTTANSASTASPSAAKPALFTTPEGRVDWVDVAKGICILFVVMMHSTLGVEELTGVTSWMGTIVAWAQPFRMPDFFFIAGLFLVRTIDAPWQRYLDRKVVHFAYFYLLWLVIQVAIKHGALTGDVTGSLHLMLQSLYQPFGTLWFVYMLPIFFLVVRLTKHLPIWLMLGIGAALEIAPIGTGYLLIDEFASRFVYFYAGYALAGYAFALADKATARPMVGAMGLFAWGVINTVAVFTDVQVLGQTYSLAHLPFLSLALGAMGALAVITTAALVTRTLVGRSFSYMGARSIVIYLAFFFPMVVVREVGFRLGLVPDTGTLALLTTLIAVVAPLILYWIIAKIGFGRFLFERPAWAHIDRPRRGQPVSIAPAE
ncbi:MAG: acyltransferase family protein [Hyphomicrobiales bacterium]|jgi:uncharacterized membrane protein YcfT